MVEHRFCNPRMAVRFCHGAPTIMENAMSPKETLEKAYGSIPKEVGVYHDWGVPTWRGIKYYWHSLVRKLTR